MTNLLKSLIMAVMAVLIPMLYAAISDLAPGLPISESNFTSFIVWLISALITGGASQKMLEHFNDQLLFKGVGRAQNSAKSIAVYILFGLILLAVILFTI